VKIVWTEPAHLDLRDIFTYIAEDNPLLGRTVRIDGIRELVLAGSLYILTYRLKRTADSDFGGFSWRKTGRKAFAARQESSSPQKR